MLGVQRSEFSPTTRLAETTTVTVADIELILDKRYTTTDGIGGKVRTPPCGYDDDDVLYLWLDGTVAFLIGDDGNIYRCSYTIRDDYDPWQGGIAEDGRIYLYVDGDFYSEGDPVAHVRDLVADDEDEEA